MSTDRDVIIGLAVGGVRAGAAAGEIALLPFRTAARAPLVGPPLRRAGRDLAHQGALARARLRAQLEAAGGELLATADVDRIVGAILDHEITERALERALASAGLERLVVRVLDSEFLDAVTERVLASPEMDRVVAHIANSPEVLDAVSRQTQTFADEMVADARRRTRTVDDVAERTVRGWLRRPRPEPA